MQNNVTFLLYNEYRNRSSPTGGLFVDVYEELLKRGIETRFVGSNRTYQPGGLKFARLLNAIFLPVLFFNFLFYEKLRSVVAKRSLVLLISTSPPLSHLFIIPLSNLFRIRCVLWYFDAHPKLEIDIIQKYCGEFVSKAFAALSRFLLVGLSEIILLESEMLPTLGINDARYLKTIVIPPWGTFASPSRPFEPVSVRKRRGIRVLHAGNYGIAHSMRGIFDNLAQLKQNGLLDDVFIRIIGASDKSRVRIDSELGALRSYAEFIPRIDKFSEVLKLMEEMDFGIVTRGVDTHVFPSKVFTYLSQGLRILYDGPMGEFWRNLEEQGYLSHRSSISDSGGFEQWLYKLESRNIIGKLYPDPRDLYLQRILGFLLRDS